MTLELETMSIIAASLKEDGTSGTITNPGAGTGSGGHYSASRTYFNSWENEDDMDDYDY